MDEFKAVQASIERVLANPAYHDPLVLIKSIRNGIVYGAKIRFPHALVMVLLFRNGTLREKLWAVYKATRQHALNLAKFAFIYKSTGILMRQANGGKEASIHTFLSGLLGGYYVFGRTNNSVNQQIVIYVAARVALALAKLCVTPPGTNKLIGGSYGEYTGRGLLGLSEEKAALIRNHTWPVFAGLSWAGVMWLFRWYPEMLQPSLKSSMVYIYDNAEKWDNFDNFLIKNI